MTGRSRSGATGTGWLEPSAGITKRRGLRPILDPSNPTAPTNAMRLPSGENSGSAAEATRDATFRERPPPVGISQRSATIQSSLRPRVRSEKQAAGAPAGDQQGFL